MLGSWFVRGQDSQGAPARAEGNRAKPPAKAAPVVRKPKPAVSVGRSEMPAAAPATRKPTTAVEPVGRAPAPAPTKKRGLFSKAAQPKPVVKSQPAPAPAAQPTTRPAIGRDTALPTTASAPARSLFSSVATFKTQAARRAAAFDTSAVPPPPPPRSTGRDEADETEP